MFEGLVVMAFPLWHFQGAYRLEAIEGFMFRRLLMNRSFSFRKEVALISKGTLCYYRYAVLLDPKVGEGAY